MARFHAPLHSALPRGRGRTIEVLIAEPIDPGVEIQQFKHVHEAAKEFNVSTSAVGESIRTGRIVQKCRRIFRAVQVAA